MKVSRKDLNKMSTREVLSSAKGPMMRLFSYLKPYKARFFGALVFGVLAAAVNSTQLGIMQLVTGKLLDGKSTGDAAAVPEKPGPAAIWIRDGLEYLGLNVSDHSLRALVILCAMIPLIVMIRTVFGYLNSYLLTWVSLRVLDDIRSQLFRKVLGQSMEFFSKQKGGDLHQTVMNQTRVAQQALTSMSTDLLKEPLMILFVVLTLLWTDWQFTLIAFTVFPLFIIPVIIIGKKVRKASAEEENEAGAMSVIMEESFSGIREVKSYGREDYEVKRFNESNRKMLRSMMRWRKAMEISGPLVEVIAACGIAGAFIYIFHRPDISGSDFLTLIAGLMMLYAPAKALSRVPLMMQKCLVSTSKIFDMMDRPVKVPDAPDALVLKKCRGHVQFDNVTYFYKKDVPALKNVTLEINPGEKVALVGPNGAGKTTLLAMLLRFYDPHDGAVLVDGHDIRTVTQVSLRNQIGTVSQEPFLFHETILENIRYGRLNATDEEVIAASQKAYAHEFIMQKSEGYEYSVGDRGRNVSGGQRQRISIARAILKNAPILLLDEATSALDAEVERQVVDALDELSQNKTLIAIAHRLSTVINADKIVVMEAGGIVDVGRHEELLERCDLYRNLYSRGFQDEEPAAEEGAAPAPAAVLTDAPEG